MTSYLGWDTSMEAPDLACASFPRCASAGSARPVRRERLWENRLLAPFAFVFVVAGFFINSDWAESPGGWLTPGALNGVALDMVVFALGVRTLSLGVEVRDEDFLVRNIIRTYRLPFDQVEGFRLTRSRWGGRTQRITGLTPGPGGILWQRKRVDAALDRLNGVVKGTSTKALTDERISGTKPNKSMR